MGRTVVKESSFSVAIFSYGGQENTPNVSRLLSADRYQQSYGF